MWSGANTVGCPERHALRIFTTTAECVTFCNVCNMDFETGVTMHGCGPCDWDLCEACLSKSKCPPSCTTSARPPSASPHLVAYTYASVRALKKTYQHQNLPKPTNTVDTQQTEKRAHEAGIEAIVTNDDCYDGFNEGFATTSKSATVQWNGTAKRPRKRTGTGSIARGSTARGREWAH